jgi:hypothetical protein
MIRDRGDIEVLQLNTHHLNRAKRFVVIQIVPNVLLSLTFVYVKYTHVLIGIAYISICIEIDFFTS